MEAAAIAVSLAVGSAWGAMMPLASSALLARKKRTVAAWWSKSLDRYVDFVASNGRPPLPSAPGVEGAAGIWYEDAVRSAALGVLDDGRLAKLSALGAPLPDRPDSPQGFVPSYDIGRKAPWGACAGTAMALAVAASAYAGAAWPQTIIYAVITALCALVIACDARARIIPWELSLAMSMAGFALLALSSGIQAAVATLAAAIIAMAAVFASDLIASRLGKAGAIGGGDIRFIPALVLCCGPAGAVPGCAAMSVAFIIYTIVGAFRGKVTMRSMIPFGPFLVTGSLVGAFSPLLF